ncbi:hypothetical protein CAPTEDRAFT_201495 [Capitella teleta]|uniref:Thioesterase domain-containing protein n=1 Tax=Capitella teleta TaxID=283909 RepID=R7UN32_CAPTE|nr:hypothetical protein CAPTEDRAFT_201495 [Capitella teleta]|eukprot:ELU04801.1 hypothetical protein CAPTEDRAFT_201495 [Capitella teleta]
MQKLGLYEMCYQVSMITKFDVETADDDITKHFSLHGFSFGDFDRKGRLAFWSACKAFELNRVYMIKIVWKPQCLTMVVSQTWEMSRSLYDRAAVEYPMACSTSVEKVGPTSLDVILQVHDKETGELLVNNSRKVVYVNPETFKSTTVPDRISNLVEQGKLSRRTSEKLILPEDYHSYKHYVHSIMAAPSELDHLNHVNQSVYFKYSLDAAYFAWKKGLLPSLGPNEPADWLVRRADAIYKKQLFPRDEVIITCWESRKEPVTLNCVIHSKADHVASVQIIFYSLADAKL